MRKVKLVSLLSAAMLLCAHVSHANAASPTAPSNVVAKRTSDSTVSITWSRSSDDVGVSGYNVYRDDRQISTVSNPRLADIQLAPSVVYTYYVVAFDADNNFSARSNTASTDGTTTTTTTDTSENSPVTVKVNGNRITWPDDGWYQVQDVPNYTEQCAGTRFCDVGPGRYQVVNHTTGERFPIVTVGQGDTSSNDNSSNTGTGTAIDVNGNRISWPDDGWYQVQDAHTFAEQCNGTRFCDVSPGNYIVVNHTTGERNTVVVTGDSSLPSGDYINAGNALDRWASVVSVINGDPLDTLFNNLQNELSYLGLRNTGLRDINGIAFSENTTTNPPYQFVENPNFTYGVSDQNVYSCSSGGRVLQYGSRAFPGFDNVFENCAIGAIQFSGTAGGRSLGRAVINRYPYVNFERLGSNGDTHSIDGEYYTGNESRAIDDIKNGWRNLNFSDSANNVELTNYNIDRTDFNGDFFRGETATTVNGVVINVKDYEVRATVSGQFTVSAPFTEGLTLNVTVNLAYQDRVREAAENPQLDFPGRDPQLPFSWQTGRVTISASDGSVLTVLPADNNSFLLVLGNGDSLGPFAWTGRFELSLD